MSDTPNPGEQFSGLPMESLIGGPELPLLSLTPIPTFTPDEAAVNFEMEVKAAGEEEKR